MPRIRRGRSVGTEVAYGVRVSESKRRGHVGQHLRTHLPVAGQRGRRLSRTALVDEKMRDVAEATGTADTLKVAILAALNVADEYLQAGSGGPRAPNRGANEKQLARMITLLDEVLTE